MDTLKDKQMLETLAERGNRPVGRLGPERGRTEPWPRRRPE